MKILRSVLVLVLCLPAAAQDLSIVPIDRRVDAHMNFLASDEMAGRETGTIHGLITAQYVATTFRSLGLVPAGDDGTYLQRYPLESSRLKVDDVKVEMGDRSFTLFDDLLVRGFGSGGLFVTAPLAFVGHGVVSERAGIDDYEGLDIDGRIAVMRWGAPEDLRPEGHWRMKRDAARQRGALGMAIMADTEDPRIDGYLRVMESMTRNPTMGLPHEETEAGFPVLFLKPAATRAILQAGGADPDDPERGPLSGPPLSIVAPVEVDGTWAYNVAGVVPGTDADVAAETVIISAHMDHVGVDSDGEIYNGADDNASGTTVLLTAAEVLARNPAPRRSVMFLAVSGEEKGLLGSEWWVGHPTWPLEEVVANVNIDMVGRNDPDSIGLTPSPDHPDFNTLAQRALDVGPRAGLEVKWTAGLGEYERRVDEYYHRSDHAHFAAQGIPVAFFFAGEHADYHGPGDEIDKVDLGKVGRMAGLISMLVTDVANDVQRPQPIKE